jgi:hypothetical protein
MPLKTFMDLSNNKKAQVLEMVITALIQQGILTESNGKLSVA